MRVGDLAYQLNNQEAFFLRREGQRLLLAGVASFADFSALIGFIPPDVLFIGISALRGFCEFFAGEITFRTPVLELADSNDELGGDIIGLAIPSS
jgi:hypothetical protein